MTHPIAIVAAIAALIFAAVAEAAGPMPEGFDPELHMPVDEVKPGMTGYGLSVFAGTRIETFDVVVASVEEGFNPGKKVVWMRCTDDRMQHLGPVSGMSGSPIFLWDDHVPAGQRIAGKGGRMIGAFAYGYGGGKDCYAGVQPIEQMLAARQRAGTGKELSGGGQLNPRQLLAIGLAEAQRGRVPDDQAWRMKMMAEWVGVEPAVDAPAPLTTATGRRNTLMLPVGVGSTAHAESLRPFLAPTGIVPLAGSGAAGRPPQWIDRSVKPQRGGVAAVPLMTGDTEFAVVGTITEVLPDGSAVHFGHAYQQQGASKKPFSTGYIHFVQPHMGGSFKLGASIKPAGTIVNDEFAAVVSRPFISVPHYPAKVRVNWPGNESKSRAYNYQIAYDKYYSPLLAGYAVAMSVGADTEPPDDSSLRLKAKVKFEGDRELDIDTTMPMAGSFSTLYALVSPIAAVADTPFGKIEFRGIEAEVEVVDRVRQAQITELSLRRKTVKPGETIHATVNLRPYKGEPYTRSITIDVPADAKPGQRQLLIGGARPYTQRVMELRPYKARIENIDQLFEMVSFIATVKPEAIYAVLSDNGAPQLAIGRTPMPDVPSSTASLLAAGTHTLAMPYIRSIESVVETTDVIVGAQNVQITIEDPSSTSGG